MIARHFFLAVSILLTACGGGGQSSPIQPAPNPAPQPSAATISFSGSSTFSSPFIRLSGSSSGISGDVTLSFAQREYTVTPSAAGAWSWQAVQCSQALPNGTYSIGAQGVASDGSNVTKSTTMTVAASDEYMRVHYYRRDGNYQGWGLHLWGQAIPSSVITTWASPRVFDCRDNGWVEYWVPLSDANQAFNFIVHQGDNKNTPDDLVLLPSTFGRNVFIVQGDPSLYATREEALVAAENVGNASATLDLTEVGIGNTQSALAEGWADGAAFIEIYVRGYQDSDGDGKGDLAGLIQRLPYLAELGVKGIWLMPITESSDNDHGYAVSNYRDIEDDYGDLSDFQTLLNEAHQLGIGIIMDYVMNHSSSANPLFLDAVSAPDNPKRDWYNFASTDLGWGPWGNGWRASADGDYYYSPFSPTMPDFNLRNPDVVDFHLNNLRYWLNMGVDGFRFDAVGVLYEATDGSVTINHPDNHPLLARVKDVIESYDNRYMVCEAPDGPALYASDVSCGKAFAFGVQSAILQSVVSGVLHSDVYDFLNQSARDRMPLILSNHDHFAGDRPMSYMLRQNGIDSSNVDAYLKAAASVYMLLSATPFTYYGEEVGQTGAGGDWDLRRPMSWLDDAATAGFTTGVPFRPPVDNVLTNNVQMMSAMNSSLLAHYQALFQVRERYPVIARGRLAALSQRGDSVLAFSRESNGQSVTMLVNLSAQTQVKQLAKSQSVTYADVLQTHAVAINELAVDAISVTLPPHAAAVIVGQ